MPAQELTTSAIPLLMVLIPLACGGAIFLAGLVSEKAVRRLFAVSAAGPLALLPFLMAPVLRGEVLVLSFPTLLPPGGLGFRVDLLSAFMAALYCVFGAILFAYTLEYMKDREKRHRFWGAFALILGGCLGVALAGNLLTFFLFFEFMSVILFILIAHNQTAETQAATMKFLYMTVLAGVALFVGVVLTYLQAGSLEFGQGGIFPPGTVPALAGFAGFLVAFGIKSAMFPLHLWMPDAYTVAPIPAAALSSGMLLKTGAYGFIRIIYDIYGLETVRQLHWNEFILGLAVISILYGSLNALSQDDLNRRLAYSGIAQIGYITLGIALLNEAAFIGNIYHIFAHAFMKGCLFLCAGAILQLTGKRRISELGGLGLQMPFTMLAFTIAALTAVGLPPFNVFVVKWHLGLAALEVGQPLYLVLLLASSMLNAAYYLPISITAFLGKGAIEQHAISRAVRIKAASPKLLAPMYLLMIGCFFFTLAPANWPLDLARRIAHVFFAASP